MVRNIRLMMMKRRAWTYSESSVHHDEVEKSDVSSNSTIAVGARSTFPLRYQHVMFGQKSCFQTALRRSEECGQVPDHPRFAGGTEMTSFTPEI
jgi:hypothetical protein